MGKNCAVYGKFEIRNPWKISIEDNTSIGHRTTLDGRGGLTIGNNVNISSEVMVWIWQHGCDSPTFEIVSKPLIIEDYAWVSVRAIVLPGVTIAKGSIIAAGSVITKDTEPYSAYGGIPEKKLDQKS